MSQTRAVAAIDRMMRLIEDAAILDQGEIGCY